MASNLQLSSGSPLIGSPIFYQVTAASPVGDVTFQRVKLYVYARLQSDASSKKYELSQPVGKGETVTIDISSALVSAADKYQHEATPPNYYPYVEFSLEACDEYMQNGQNSGDVGVVTNPGGRALIGRFSDYERLVSLQAGRTTSRFSRKPFTSPEIVTVGETYLRPEPMTVSIGNIQHGQHVLSQTITRSGAQTLWGGTDHAVSVYAVADSKDRYKMRFLNSLGCVESISVSALVQEEVAVESSEYMLSRQTAFNHVNRGIIIKQNDQERFKLSSGPVDRAWQQWFLHELLMTERAWLLIDTVWIPCNIIAEETTQGIDRTSGNALTVDFTVRLDIAGSPYAALAI